MKQSVQNAHMNQFERAEQIAAECIVELASVHVFQYATEQDREAAQVAVLNLALELSHSNHFDTHEAGGINSPAGLSGARV